MRPRYQNSTISQYLKSQKTNFSGLYNKNGRAYPDISAQGSNIVTIWNGDVGIKSGTAASTAVAAAIFALINDVRLRNKHRPLGFLNPLIYGRLKEGFTDVTNGSAVGCGVEGFRAGVGWDAVTGWGTPVSFD
jgi:tripeptidyl-peptidase-1